MSGRQAGLSRQENAACTVARRVLGVEVEEWDVDGRQGAVDAFLIYPGGRRAAFEVTTLAADEAMELHARLGSTGFEWPSPGGRWWWSVSVGSVHDLPRLKRCYARIALQCEAAGVVRPDMLWPRHVDADLRWLIGESSSSMFGHPDVPAVNGDKVRNTWVGPAGRGGATDDTLERLHDALTDMFALPHIVKHRAKLAGTGATERHLFLPVHWTALPFDVADALATGTSVPSDPPPLPPEITHLWLAPQFGPRVLLGTSEGWQQYHPYDHESRPAP